MKPIIRKILILLPVILLSAGFVWQMQEKKDYGRSVLPAGKVHDGWYFAAGREVVIDGTVNGDVYAAGAIVEINGTVNGDVLVAGGQVTVGGTVKEDIRGAGGMVTIAGQVDGNCTVAGGNVTLAKSAKVKDSFLAACGTLRLQGSVDREAVVAAGEMGMSGSVGGGLKFKGERLALYEGATVGKDLNATVEDTTKVEIAANTVKGSVDVKIREARGYRGGGYLFKTLWALSLVLTALVVVLVFPKQVNAVGTLAMDEPGKTILWGFLGLIVIPIAVVIAMVTVIGIPIALFVVFLYCWFLYLAHLSLPLLLGKWLRKADSSKFWRTFWPIAVGIVVVQLLMLVPYLRGLLLLAGLIVGFGMILITMVSKLKVKG